MRDCILVISDCPEHGQTGLSLKLLCVASGCIDRFPQDCRPDPKCKSDYETERQVELLPRRNRRGWNRRALYYGHLNGGALAIGGCLQGAHIGRELVAYCVREHCGTRCRG